jgi:hypothetical protein
VSGEAICRNENNQIIVKNARNPSGSKYTRDVSQMMERLDAIDLSTTDEIESFEKQSYDDDHDEIESFEKQSYDDDFSNMVFHLKHKKVDRIFRRDANKKTRLYVLLAKYYSYSAITSTEEEKD